MSQISTVAAPASLHGNDIETSLFGEPPADPSLKFAAAMIMAMLDSGEGISDLVFSPGRPPQVERHGHLTPVVIPQVPVLEPEHTARIARELINGSRAPLLALSDHRRRGPSHFVS